MFPDPDDGPPSFFQGSIVSAVSFEILSQLRLPPGGVRLWESCVLGAAMPEASVHEYGDLRRGEYDVSLTAEAR
jgi:hypothetical protein